MSKSYYAVIPATVRYDKRLPDGAKLLYGEITALCNERGFCWATNQYFADLYDKSTSTIKRWISKLEECGYIIRNFRYKDGSKEIDERCITICDTPAQYCDEVGAEIDLPPVQKCDDPRCKNEPDNITVNNTTNTTELFAQFWEAYPKKRSKDDAFKAFKSRKPNPVLVGEMIAAVQLMKDSGEWASDRIQYIPYPATWLRAGGWKDEVSPHKKEPEGKRWRQLD